MDNNDIFKNNTIQWRVRQLLDSGKYDANQLDSKQRHTGFDYYEYSMPKFGAPGWVQSQLDENRFNFQEHLEDLENDQARHQGIHGHGRDETCYTQRRPPANNLKKFVL